MSSTIFRFVVFLAATLILGCTSAATQPQAAVETCPQQVPNPPQPSGFYEDNPTYVDSTANPNSFPTATPESQGMDSKILASGDAQLVNVPQALSLLVIRNGILVHENYFHGSAFNQANNVHSASKSLLSGLVGIAIDQGFIDSIDQKVSDILSDYTFTAQTKDLTIKNLLTMSAGFDWTEDVTESVIEDQDDWVQAILNIPIIKPAGTTFDYNTGLTHLLSAIITESSGMDTCNFGAKYLYTPMGIKIKHWGRDPQGYYSGGYNFYLTARDLAQLAQLYLQKGQWNGTSIIPSAWVTDATTSKIQTEHPQFTYGYLWWLFTVAGHPVYKMWGYGGQFAYLVPDLNLVMITTADTKQDHPEYDGDSFLANYVIAAVKPLAPVTKRLTK